MRPTVVGLRIWREAQDWAVHAQRLNELGVPVTPAALKEAPRHLDVSERLLARLQSAGN